jgi:hypothetical protein
MTLKACPWCQGEVMSYMYDVDAVGPGFNRFVHAVVCPGCGARGPWSKPDGGDDDAGRLDAQRAWNDRPA